MLNVIFEAMGLYDLTTAFKNMMDFADATIKDHLADFNPEDESQDYVQAFLKESFSNRFVIVGACRFLM